MDAPTACALSRSQRSAVEEQTVADERLREEQLTTDERLREEQLTTDERLREEQLTGVEV